MSGKRGKGILKSVKKSLFFLICILFLAVGCAAAEEEISEPEVTATPRPTPAPELEIPVIDPAECSHFWRIPDCHTPMYCLDCGEIYSGPTPHEPSEANFQQPSVCLICGDVLGDVLEPNFTALGFEINTTTRRSYEFRTVTYLDSEIEITGSAALLFVDIFETEPDYPRKAGYEFIRARFMMTFDDEAVVTHGFMYVIGHVDYYSMNLTDQSLPFEQLIESEYPGFRVSNRTINFNGQEREYFIRYEEITTTMADGTAEAIREYTFLVPAGYDGIVVYLSSAALWTESRGRIISNNIDGNTLFFRLRTQTD